jgi:hypothetical protein
MQWFISFILIYLISILISWVYEFIVYDRRYSWVQCFRYMPVIVYIPLLNTFYVFLAIYDIIYYKFKKYR